MKTLIPVAALFVSLGLAACASTPKDPEEEIAAATAEGTYRVTCEKTRRTGSRLPPKDCDSIESNMVISGGSISTPPAVPTGGRPEGGNN